MPTALCNTFLFSEYPVTALLLQTQFLKMSLKSFSKSENWEWGFAWNELGIWRFLPAQVSQLLFIFLREKKSDHDK